MACTVTGCEREATARGLCGRHYAQAWKEKAAAAPCNVAGCARPCFCKGMCKGHYARSRRGVDLAAPVREFARGNAILAMRLDRASLAVLKERAAAAGVSPNKWAVRLLRRALGME